MTRSTVPYSERRPYTPPAGYGFNPDKPVPGHYRLRVHGVAQGIRIWFGAPLDPVTGDELDRGPRWQAERNGEPVDLEHVWPRCAADKITADEYAYLTQLARWTDDAGVQASDPLQSPMMF